MAYLAVALNHFREVQSWANTAKAEMTVDLGNFELEVKCRHRCYKFFPQFINEMQGAMGHSPVLTMETVGFIGWLPYKPLGWKLSGDKLAFKEFLALVGESTPPSWLDLTQVNVDYILKRSAGSFGYELAGPFRAAQAVSQNMGEHVPGVRGVPFAEKFIKGENLKVWFWGEQPFYAQRHPYPQVQGDGKLTLGQLIDNKLKQLGKALADGSSDKIAMNSVVAYQQLHLRDVVQDGKVIWLDYRYGRQYVLDKVHRATDNYLPTFAQGLMDQIVRLGDKLATELQKEFPAPVLYSVDGVVDRDGLVWWLEMNSNPMFPPDGYPLVFSTLFGPSSLNDFVDIQRSELISI